MTITELGALGEFVGAIAVVATLIYLAVQVRHSKEATEASNRLAVAAVYRETSNGLMQFNGRLIKSEDIARLWLDGGSGEEELSDTDELRYRRLALDWITFREAGYFGAEAARDEQAMERNFRILARTIANSPGLREVWESLNWTNAFATAVSHQLEELRGDTSMTTQDAKAME